MMPKNISDMVKNLTDNERVVLKSLFHNYYGEKGDGVWSHAVNDSHEPSGLSGKTLSGVVSSLVQKGYYVRSEYEKNEWALWTTSLGKELMKELFE